MKAGQKAETILAAAEELFSMQGFKRTTVADIADQAGVVGGTVIYHFKKKENLLLEISLRLLKKFQIKVMANIKKAKHGFAAVKIFCHEFFAFLSHSPGSFGVYFRDIPSETLKSFDHEKSLTIRRRQRILLLILESALARGMDDGSIRPGNRQDEAMRIMAALLGAAWMCLVFNSNPKEMCRGLDDIHLKALKGEALGG